MVQDVYQKCKRTILFTSDSTTFSFAEVLPVRYSALFLDVDALASSVGRNRDRVSHLLQNPK